MFQIEPIARERSAAPPREQSLSETGPERHVRSPAISPHIGTIAVIISTHGRPDIISALVQSLAEQTRAPDHVFVIASRGEDVVGLDRNDPSLTVHIGRPGSSHQRNDGLALAGSRFDYIAFFDDDFVPSRFWLERMVSIFEARPDVAGLTGTILADGTTTEGVRLDEAQSMVQRRDFNSPDRGVLHERFAFGGNMGCNMAFRCAALRDIRFDERLPLYAWLEDHDFRGQVERAGHMVRADALWGVHLGHKQGRVPGATLGYSQIANALYLARKGTVPKLYLAKLAAKNVLINALRSLWPESFVDRRGRLRGNVIALLDLLRGRLAPERALELLKGKAPKVAASAAAKPKPARSHSAA